MPQSSFNGCREVSPEAADWEAGRTRAMGRACRKSMQSRRYWKSVDEDAGSTHCFSAPGKGRSWGTPCLMITCKAACTRYTRRAGKRFSRQTVHASDDILPHRATAILGSTHQASSRHAPRQCMGEDCSFQCMPHHSSHEAS